MRQDQQRTEEPPLENPPPKEPRTVSKGTLGLIGLVMLMAFLGGGWWHYRTKVLPERLFMEAEDLYRAGRYAEALPVYQRVYQLRPVRKDVVLRIALCQERLGRLNDAMDSFDLQSRLDPKDPRPLLGKGRILLSLGRPEEALGLLKRAQKLSSSSPYSNRLLAEAYRRVGSHDMAIKHLKLSAERDRDPERVLMDAKDLFQLKDFEGARWAFERTLELSPDHRGARHGLDAANAMLGIPNDRNLLVVPGRSLGPVEIGMSRDQVLETLGEPNGSDGLDVSGRAYEVWTYNSVTLKDQPGVKYPALRILFDPSGTVVQAESSSDRYKTYDGIGTMSFMKDRLKDRFEIWQENTHDHLGYRYCLKGGGLTLYVSDLGGVTDQGERRALVVHRGFLPVDDVSPDLWVRVEPN